MSFKKATVAALFLFTSISLFASQKILEFSASQNGYVGTYMSYHFSVRDKSYSNIHEFANSLKPVNFSVPNFGLKDSTLWVTFTMRSEDSSTPFVVVENSWLDRATLFEVLPDGSLHEMYDIDDRSFDERVIKTTEIVFPLSLHKGEQRQFVMRFDCLEQFMLPVKLESQNTFLIYKSNTNLFAGFYYGLILVMILYNIFIYISVRDNNYLLYVLSIAAIGLTQFTLDGYGFKFLWPGNEWLADKSVNLMGIFSGITTVIFSQSFLKIKRYYKPMYWVFNGYIGLYVISFIVLLMNMTSLSYKIISFNAGSSFLLIIVAALILRKGYRPAKFYLIALTLFLIGVMIFVFKDLNYLPYNLWTVNSVKIGSAFEVVLLSFALADRINTLKREREESRLKAIEVLKENERIIREQNILLEQKVKERTKDLEIANDELAKTLKNLTDAQTQLVESEKMASLGQLTAGVAHEINNPINFVTSNINPLKMDIQDLIEVLGKYDALIEEEGELREKLIEIQKYKKDIDFEYSLDEIDSLLTGIEEGAKRTANIVKGLKNFSRMDEEGYKHHNLEEGLDSTLIILNNALKNKIKLVKDYGGIPKVECRGDKINQIFMNIISNAIQAIEMKEEVTDHETITITTRREGPDMVSISIKDTGMGMSEEVKSKIFEPFFTTKPVGQGTGLGMAIVFGILEDHRGEIIVNSELGVGTEFVIKLPVDHYTA